MSNREQKSISKEALAIALIELCDSKPFSAITISEISTLAGVSRMAFYRHFNNKEEIFTDYFASILKKFLLDSKKWRNSKFGNQENIERCFSYFRQYERFIRCLIKVHLSDILLQNVIEVVINYYYTKVDKKYYYYIVSYAGSIFAAYMTWLRNDFKDDPKQIAKCICNIFKEKYSVR